MDGSLQLETARPRSANPLHVNTALPARSPVADHVMEDVQRLGTSSPQGFVERALPSKLRWSVEALSQTTGVSPDAPFVPLCNGLHGPECDHKARNYSRSLSARDSDGRLEFGKAKA
ncbi:unnamed protein product [Gadus morhua 'NCC']